MTDAELISQEALIQEIAVKHGITVGHNDPILILQTMNARLMDNNAKAQQVMLHQYKEELEGIALRWEHDAKEKSELILNAALEASKNTMTTLLQSSAKSTVLSIKKEVDEKLAQTNNALRHTEKIATINMCASGVTLLAAFIFAIGIIFK